MSKQCQQFLQVYMLSLYTHHLMVQHVSFLSYSTKHSGMQCSEYRYCHHVKSGFRFVNIECELYLAIQDLFSILIYILTSISNRDILLSLIICLSHLDKLCIKGIYMQQQHVLSIFMEKEQNVILGCYSKNIRH